MKRKKCLKCGTSKNLHVNSSRVNKDGRKVIYYYCRSCTAERMKRWYHSLSKTEKKVYSYLCNKWNREHHRDGRLKVR